MGFSDNPKRPTNNFLNFECVDGGSNSRSIIYVHCWRTLFGDKGVQRCKRTWHIRKLWKVGAGVDELNMGGPGRGETKDVLQTASGPTMEVNRLGSGG